MPAVADHRTLLKSAAGFSLAGLLLYPFAWVLGWAAVVSILRSADPVWLTAALAASAICLVCWALGWDIVLSAIGAQVPVYSLVVAQYAATFVNYITPLGKTSGTPISAYILSTHHRAPNQESLASIVQTPGGVGGVEAAIVLLLSGLAGIPVATAGAIALLYRLTSYWFIVAAGSLAALWVGWR